MRSITPIDACLNTIDYLQKNRDQLPEELTEWLLPGLLKLRSGRIKNLNDALGLSVGPGEARQQLCYVYPTRERNRLIREAAAKLKTAYDDKLTIARILDCAMNRGIPSVQVEDSFETMMMLCNLRYFCLNYDGDPKLAVGWQRVLQILDGDG